MNRKYKKETNTIRLNKGVGTLIISIYKYLNTVFSIKKVYRKEEIYILICYLFEIFLTISYLFIELSSIFF